MCQFASFVLTKDREFWSETNDSHTTIIAEHGLYEDGVRGPNLLKVELLPTENTFDLSAWQYRVDQDVVPSWVSADEEERTRRAAQRRFHDLSKRKLSAGGDLDLGSLTSLPDNTQLSAGGDLDLSSLTRREDTGLRARRIYWAGEKQA